MTCPHTDCHDEPFDDMLTTHVPERSLDVATNLRYPFWTGIWSCLGGAPDNWDVGELIWMQDYPLPRDTRAQRGGGGLAEAHYHVVGQVKKGLLPPQDAQKG